GAMMLLSLLIWLWNLQLRGLMRRRTAALAESEAKYRALIETTDTGFVILDQAGRVLDANQAYVRLTGRGSLEEIRGRSVVEWTHPQDQARNQAEVEKCLARGQVRNLEIRYLPAGGGELPVEINATVVESAGQPVILSVCRDISQRKQAEEALRENQERLRLLGDNLPNAVFYQVVAHPGGSRRFTYVSGSVERLSEMPAQEVLADPERLYGQILPEHRQEMRSREEKSLAEMSVFAMEMQARLPSGRLRWFHLAATPRRLEDGSVLWDGVAVDITQRVRAEEALRKSEDKHRLVLEESTYPIFSFLPGGTYSYVNKAFATPFGKTPEEIIGKRIWDIFPHDEADKRYAVVKAVFASGQTRVIEVRVPQPVEDLYFVTSVKPVKDQEGRVLTVICISKDITERKKAEEALKESVERFRVISEESPLGISLLDRQGRYEYVNPAFVRMFGYTLAEVPDGETWFQLVYPDPQQRSQAKEDWLEDLRAHPGAEARPRTYQVRCKDNSQKTILFRPVTIASGRQVVIYEDVTERLEAEEALKESERRYRQLFEGMSDLIYTQDLEGRFLSVNPALAKAFGYTPPELLGRKASDFMKPEFQEAYQRDYLGKLRQEGHHFGLSLYFAKDGGRRYIEYHSALVTPPDGPAYISGLGRDVTELIMAERQLRRLQEQLFQSQKIEALGVLAGGIAHDFNNVLQAISGYTQLMLAEKALVGLARERLEHVEQYIARATGMIRHLMTLARKGQTHLERVDLNQEVARTAKILEHTLPRMIKIVTDLAPDLWPISADSTQVEQVLLNLSTNAGQAMPQGGELSFSTRNLTLGEQEARALSGLGPGDYGRLTVSDTGVGMDEETVSHIFEPFFTTKPRGQGTGLGLSTVYGIVTNYGGRVVCHSRPQRGATFTIYLPVAPAPAPGESQEPCPPPRSVTGNETILVVDDEPA
ncbi:MAG: PAS domain S-box protein, partial [Desulfarculus sp.]|nr:PAS domain S-box protein [Desulfarculus sp.]